MISSLRLLSARALRGARVPRRPKSRYLLLTNFAVIHVTYNQKYSCATW